MSLLRWVWAQLTSMRTALVLLFALALAAIPGSLVPQRSISAFGVSDFIAQNPTLGPIYDKIGLFNVYSSPWFSAIYLLLFISLVGCIIPRLGVYARAVRAAPPATPRRLRRLPAYARVDTDTDPGTVLAAVEQRLRRQRFRVVRHRVDGIDSIAAERGYLREAGNLVFHVSLIFVLLGVALGVATGFRGNSVVIVGNGFSNMLTQYADFTAGSRFNGDDLAPFTVVVDKFDAEFETGPVQTGAARLFRADVTVTERPGTAPRTEVLEVNHPLDVDGTTVHLVAHGYAPRVTVRDASGEVAFAGPVVFLPQDSNLKSAGVIKAPDGRPERLAFEGFFLPTGVIEERGPQSRFPSPINPMLTLNAWYGPPKTETGAPENVYTLDPAGLTPFANPAGTDRLRFVMRIGDTYTLPDGKGSITFDGLDRWVKLQISDTPGLPLTVGSIMVAVLGLCFSLFIRPRRLWVKVHAGADDTDPDRPDDDRPDDDRPDDDRQAHDESVGNRVVESRISPTTLVEIGGLDRADARSGLAEDIEALVSVVDPDHHPDADPVPGAGREVDHEGDRR